MVSSDDASLGDQEDASKQGKKINDIDKDVEITLIDETQGRYGDDLIFDTDVLDDEEVFARQFIDEKEINVAKKEVSTADPVTTAGEVVTTTVDDLTLAQTLIKIKSAKSKVKWVMIGEQKKDQIRHDEEVAQRLQAQMQAELEEEDRLVASNDLRDVLSVIFGLSVLESQGYREPASDEEIEGPMKDQPLSADASPTALSPGYIVDSDLEEDKEDPEEDPSDHPADG
ncbi:hypothetical protein Tco_0155744 [Tanacetum coccineum]